MPVAMRGLHDVAWNLPVTPLLAQGSRYSNVNAALVREYSSTSRDELLHDLRASAQELRRYLRSLDPTEWDRDCGVRHAGTIMTIRNSVDDLIGDYDHHGRQISTWREALAPE